jgi:hypothetical protein
MQQRIRSTAAWLEQLAARADAGDTGADWVRARLAGEELREIKTLVSTHAPVRARLWS